MSDSPQVQIDSLSKRYANGVQALIDVTLTMPPGVFGLLGKNGAGKSTLMRTLATLQPADRGSAKLGEIDLLRAPERARPLIGYLPQEMGVYPHMSARETLAYFAGLKGLGSIDIGAALERVNLGDVADRRLDTFSGGMRRRFGIAVAFLGSPRLVIVDEPTAGLDPFERRRFQHLLLSAARDCVLVLSSHIVDDVADLANRMAILDAGRVVASGAPGELTATLDGQVWQRRIGYAELDAWQERARVLSWRPRSGGHVVRVWSEHRPDDSFEAVPADLEDLYAHRVGSAEA